MPETVLSRIVKRGIPQVVGVYLAAGWGVLEFTDWATQRFGLGDRVIVLVGLGLVALLPVTVFAAWKLGGRPLHAPGGSGPPGGSHGTAPPGSQDSRAPTPPPRSVAVLPFENFGGDPDQDFLAQGLSEEITSALALIPGLQVASRTSAFAFRDGQLDVRDIGTRLNVGAILEGSVQKSGDRIRISTQLVDVSNGYHLWAKRFDRDMVDLFAIEEEIAGSVARAMKVIFHRPGTRAPTDDVRAYEFYLRGRHYFRQTRRRSLEFARDMFQRAVERDPEFSLAWAGIAETISMQCMYYPSSSADLEDALEAAQQALSLSPHRAEGHCAMGIVRFLQGDLEPAFASLEKAISLDPELFDAHYFYARARFQAGDAEEAARLFGQAADLLPDDYQAPFFMGQSLESLGRSDEAVEAYARALAAALQHMELNPDDPRSATIASVSLCRLGRPEEGLEWGRRALAIDPQDAGVRYNVACLFALEGLHDEALDCLEDAMKQGFGNRDWLERDPDLDAIRDHPRFQELMARG
jgi:adenylate cyclase